ncbi:MAG: cytochrome c, partial [Phycisphaerae bacterium]
AASAALGAVILALACGPDRARSERTGTTPAGRHAVHSDRLRAVMLRVGSQTAKTWPQEIEAERAADARREQERRFEEARLLARALSRAAGDIPEAIAGVELTEAERVEFLAKADRLRQQAEQLEASAGRHDLDAMHSVLHNVRATCNDCHAQFRELAGPIPLPPSAM